MLRHEKIEENNEARECVFVRHNGCLPETDNVHQCWRPNNKNTKLQVQQRSTKSILWDKKLHHFMFAITLSNLFLFE